MEDLARIEARRASLEELGQLVGALRSMAAARAREAQAAFEGTRAYVGIIDRAIAELAQPAAMDAPAGAGERVLLLITSENGFVGGFNTALVEHAIAARAPGETLILVGRRGEVTAAERGVTADAAFAMTSRVKGVTALARRIAVRLADAVSARIVFARYTTGAGFAPTLRPVLPLRRAPAAGAPPAMPPITHLPPPALLADLSVEYLFAEIADALMESLASENAARMRTMDAASRNIDDRLETLLRDQRIAGQEKTTADMLDVVTGAEAVNNR